MTLIAYIVCLWIVDYLYFKIRYTKPNGPPVWYFFPFVGILPFYVLPRSFFMPLWNWYLKNFPDVIVCRFIMYPVVLAKNAAVRDVQHSDYCLSRPSHGLEKTLGYIMTGKPFWYFFDGKSEECDWRSIRRVNLRALNVLPKTSKFEKVADVAERFLKVIEANQDRLWDYEHDLSFAKIQETSNVNLGDTFEDNNIEEFVKFLRKMANTFHNLVFICAIPHCLMKRLQKLFPKYWRITVINRVYEKLVRGVIDRKKGATEGVPRDFVEAVLSLKEPEAAVEFIRETGMFNMVASTHTTQHTTMAALSFVALDQRVQRKIQEELDRVVGTSHLEHKHLADLHYLKAAIQEGYRMSPPVPVVLRQTSGPALVGGHVIEKDMRVATYLVSETVNPAKFPNPDDFIPERHINEDGIFESSREFNVFSRGRRMCSGADFATMSALVYCAKILHHFEVSTEHPDVVVPRYSGSALTDFPAVPLRFRRRETAPEIETVRFECNLSAFFKETVEAEMALEAD